MTRRTSIDAYNKIKEDGTLSRLRWAAYDFLFFNGPLTTRGVHGGIKQIAKDVGIVSARLAELTDMGVVEDVGTVECKETGMMVTLWDVTDRLPVKYEKPKKYKCKHCDGRGFHEEAQTKMF